MPVVTCVEVLQGIHNMEGPRSSECVAAARSQNYRESVRNGVGVDDEWEHHTICEGTLGNKPI